MTLKWETLIDSWKGRHPMLLQIISVDRYLSIENLIENLYYLIEGYRSVKNMIMMRLEIILNKFEWIQKKLNDLLVSFEDLNINLYQ